MRVNENVVIPAFRGVDAFEVRLYYHLGDETRIGRGRGGRRDVACGLAVRNAMDKAGD